MSVGCGFRSQDWHPGLLLEVLEFAGEGQRAFLLYVLGTVGDTMIINITVPYSLHSYSLRFLKYTST